MYTHISSISFTTFFDISLTRAISYFYQENMCITVINTALWHVNFPPEFTRIQQVSFLIT